MALAADLEFSYSHPDCAARIERSLRPEVGDIEGARTTATITREERSVTVAIEASDLVALRAGVNTWTTLVSVAERAGGVPGP